MQDMIEKVSEPALRVPARVGRALEANDHAKYFLALLQAARAQADSTATLRLVTWA
jgi:hypothetical protein